MSEAVCKSIPIPNPCDPNEIIGPAGVDSARWVSRQNRLEYRINFENDSTLASTSAQRVVIRQPLDSTVNALSVQLGDFGFAGQEFTVPENTNYISQVLNTAAELDVNVEVTAGVDLQRNEVFWVFQSVDPATGQPPYDPDKGLLPVKDSQGNGEGFVKYNILPAAAAQTGDSIQATANIVFDINPAIETNTWTNRVDALPPASVLDDLPDYVQPGDSLVISWTGQDDPDGSGVAFYDVYASRDGGPFLIIGEQIDSTVMLFAGETGSIYVFYTRSTDRAGNVEPPKTAGDQTVSFDNRIQIRARVLLQGPYVPAANLMHDNLRVQNRIPLTEPYTGLNTFTHAGGGGGEQTTPAVLAVSGPDAIVDWVFLELRNADMPALVVATRAALVQRDGDVVDVDGVSPVGFGHDLDTGSYYLAIRHRNHLGVQLGEPKFYERGAAVFTNFTTLPPEGFYAHNGLSPAQRLISGRYTLWAGNGRTDFQLKYNGSNNDRNSILSVVGLATPNNVVPGYRLQDYNLDGVVKYNGSANDRNVLLGNVGIATPSAVVVEQLAR
ncbi:MAG: DUF7619 domain-containing protein [Saprospiraceae bacterium]